MRKLHLVPEDKPYPAYLDSIYQALQDINTKLEKELTAKQTAIENKDLEIKELKALVNEKDFVIGDLNKDLADSQRNNEGNRQMIKKLINDMVRKQQDIEWYKRTYETRSLLGTLKEKVFGRKM